jgi:GAF domain-containing protein
MTAPPIDFESSYASAFEAYLDAPSEAALHAAYELGRDAIARELSILELAALHHDALQAALAQHASSRGTDEIVAAANEFFRETLSAFEMIRRGFRDAQEAAAVEKRNATIVRRLSDFLADTSVGAHGPDSLAEVLQLVAEQARELTAAECSVARVVIDDARPGTIEAVSYPETDDEWRTFIAESDLTRLATLIEPQGKSLRLDANGIAGASKPAAVGGRPIRGWLGTTLTGWDERPLGFIQLFDKADGEFSETDEAVVVHLAQMAITAIERARRLL